MDFKSQPRKKNVSATTMLKSGYDGNAASKNTYYLGNRKYVKYLAGSFISPQLKLVAIQVPEEYLLSFHWMLSF